MIAATVIAALAWPGFLTPPPLPSFLRKAPRIPTPAILRQGLPVPEQLVPHKRDYALPDPHGEPLAKVRYETDGGLILVPVEVDGRGPFWFALDTGSVRTLVNKAMVKPAGLRPRGGPTGDFQKLWTANFTLGGVPIYSADPVAADFTKTPLSRRRVQGFLGSELFKAYVVRIDPARRLVTLYDPSAYRPGNAAPALLTIRDGLFYTPVAIEPRYGAIAVKDARVDLGSEDFAADDAALGGQDVRQALFRDGLEWRWGKAARVRQIKVGDIPLYDAWVGADGDSRLGAGFFGRFETTFDAPHGRLWLSPTATSYLPTTGPTTTP